MLYAMLKDLIFRSDVCINTVSQREKIRWSIFRLVLLLIFYLLKNTAETLRTDTYSA